LDAVSVSSISAGVSRRHSTPWARGRAVKALIARDWRIARSYRGALVSDLAFGCLNLAAYYYISRAVKVSVHSGLDGAPNYFAFAAVGVALSVVLQAAIVGVSTRLREEQLTGTLEALCAQPISPCELALGLAGFPFLFAVFRAFVYLLIAGALLGLDFSRCAWAGLVGAFLVTGLALGAVGVCLAALVFVFKRANSVGAIGVFGMSLVGGALFPTQVLPHWLRPLSVIVPTHFAFSAARAALFGQSGWPESILALAGIGVVLGLLSMALFTLGLRYAVSRGTLNQY
jgi:ABC-2 type transport system permease protein